MMNCKEAGKYRLLDYLIMVPCPEYEPGSNLGLQERCYLNLFDGWISSSPGSCDNGPLECRGFERCPA